MLKEFARRLGRTLRAVVGNRSCVLCHQPSDDLICSVCLEDIDTFDLQQCGGNLLNLPLVSNGLTAVAFDRLIAISDYQWPVSSLIQQFKYQKGRCQGQALAELFLACCGAHCEGRDALILPVPLHPLRWAKRGFNQSSELARAIAAALGLNIDHGRLKRIRSTPAQAQGARQQRRRNLRNAFALGPGAALHHVILLDDVLTTGSTVNSLCRMIKRQYPDVFIEVWCLSVTLSRR